MTVPSTRDVDAVALRYACQAYERACRDGNGIAMLSALDSIRAALAANTHRTTDDDRVDPLAHVKPGDPDPTAKRAGGLDCDAEDDGLICTREDDHPGLHIAGDGDNVVAVWRDDA